MNYVKSFDLFGVPATQIHTIPGKGAPTTATEGAVGCLYMDTDTGDLYKCTAVADGVYTWAAIGNGAGGTVTDEQIQQIEDNKAAIEEIQTSMVCGVGISKIVKITQEEYDALETKDETTLYIIADGASEEVDPDDGMIPYLHITAPCDIDTGIVPTVDTAVEVTVYDTSLSNHNGYIGTYMYDIYGQNSPWLGATFGGVTFSVNVNNFTTTGVKNTYRLDNTGLYINGTLAKEASATPSDVGWGNYNATLRLFRRQNGAYYSTSDAAAYWLDDAKFYGAKIWQAGELVRDMIPAEDSSGVACVYDKVTGTYLYLTDTNTGTLTYGEEVDE